MAIWIVLWIVLVFLLYWNWHELPRVVAWILAVVEAFLVPDSRTLKRVFFKGQTLNDDLVSRQKH